MLISEYSPAKQAGNGIAVSFSFSFKILAVTDIVASKIDANGNVALGVLGVDYTVAFDPIAETGTVTYTLAPVSGGFSLIARDSDNQQESSLPREGLMPAKTVETMVDKAMMLVQELQAQQLLTASCQIGTLAQLTALAAANAGTPFHCIVTDKRVIGDYLGNPSLGQGGFAFYGGF